MSRLTPTMFTRESGERVLRATKAVEQTPIVHHLLRRRGRVSAVSDFWGKVNLHTKYLSRVVEGSKRHYIQLNSGWLRFHMVAKAVEVMWNYDILAPTPEAPVRSAELTGSGDAYAWVKFDTVTWSNAYAYISSSFPTEPTGSICFIPLSKWQAVIKDEQVVSWQLKNYYWLGGDVNAMGPMR